MTQPLNRMVWLLFLLAATINPGNAQQWQAIPLVSSEILNSGNTGGEGCQVVQAIEIDHTNGTFLLMGTDVGGIYRSIDGGLSWKPCNIGYSPRGNAGFAIDPNNPQRALAVGGNSTKNSSHGLYLTTDQGASWTHALAEGNYDGYRNFKDKVDFVRSSFDEVAGYSKIAYWANPAGGIYKSVNGGAAWSKVNATYGNCLLKTHPDSGYVYIANDTGFFKSSDGGLSFTNKLTAAITDMDVVGTRPNEVYLVTASALYKSTDAGENFTPITGISLPANISTIHVSPANPQFMALSNKANDWGGPIYISHNGGSNWTLSNRNHSQSFVPFNTRFQKFAWHPTDPNKIWALGGDWISSSHDGGANFEWDANGYNGILVGGLINFNVFNSDLLFIGSQDYNGAFTSDGGHSWEYCNASNLGWGGFTYGAYAANKQLLVTQNSPGWAQNGNITISRDGGQTFKETTYLCSGLFVGCGDPKDSSVIYFSNYYSHDLGETWVPMTGCKGAIVANLYGQQEVYGANGRSVVVSTDKGVTWTVLKTLSYNVVDIAIDHVLNRLYIATANDRLYKLEGATLTDLTVKIPADQYGSRTIQTVAVDPQSPNMLYVAGAKNIYKTDASVKRSLDGGDTWEIITPNTRTNNGSQLGDGANEVFAIRVNPSNRELWGAGGCYGLWKDVNSNKAHINIVSPVYHAEYLSPAAILIETETFEPLSPFVKVEFFEGETKIGEDTEKPFNHFWQDAPPGRYVIHAMATDANGKSFHAPAINLHVLASQRPSINITSPLKDAIFAESETILIEVEATDTDGSIAKVAFFNNTTKLGESTIPPFSFSWNNVPLGKYNLKAIATDNSGETGTSASVPVLVSQYAHKLYYFEDFNDGLAQDWGAISGTWGVTNSQYRLSNSSGRYLSVYNGTTFADYTFSTRINSEWNNLFGVIFNFVNNNNYYLLVLDADPKTVELKRVQNGAETTKTTATYTGGGSGVFLPIKITNNGTTTSVEINNSLVFNQVPTTEFPFGKIGLYGWYNLVNFDDVEVIAEDAYLANPKTPHDQTHDFIAFPNPSSTGLVSIKSHHFFHHAELSIYTLAGQKIISEKKSRSDAFLIDAGNLPSKGLFLFHIVADNQLYTGKLLKQ